MTAEKFWARVRRTPTCWYWTGPPSTGGYGHATWAGRVHQAHRVAWAITYNDGNVPTRCVLHRCDTPACVRPDHLFLGTRRDNIADMVAKGRQRGALGENNPKAKLTTQQVLAIREARGRVFQRDLAKQYNVCIRTIQLVQLGHQWTNVTR